jgi:hypothetical protein
MYNNAFKLTIDAICDINLTIVVVVIIVGGLTNLVGGRLG